VAATEPRPPGQARALVVVAASVLAVVAGASARREAAPSEAPATPGPSEPSAPPPLPSGAERQTPVASDDSSGDGCSFPESGFGSFAIWRDLPEIAVPRGAGVHPRARLLVRAAGGGLDDEGGFDLLVHFHGAEPVRKVLAAADPALVIAAVDAGTRSSHYERALAGDGAFGGLVRGAEAEVALATGRLEAHARHLIVSSWSAGYGAVGQVLRGPHERVDAVVLLDSLHASYAPGGSVDGATLEGFVVMAQRAADDAPSAGAPFFVLTHSEVRPEGYASTTEAASYVLAKVGAREITVDPGGSERPHLTGLYEQGHLFVRGYAGATRDDHCAQIRLLPGILVEHVLPGLRR
jgi:hypothetical protein